MKPSEILRSLADLIDAKSKETQDDLAQQPDDLFVPPLQLKMELLKKATGVENIYDGDEDNDPPHGYDDLQAIKRNAGIENVNPAVLSALSDDEPLDD
jgi:hypothetical protein